MIRWPWDKGVQKVVIELKLVHKSLERTIVEGKRQTVEYMDKCGADDGHLVIFDRRPKRKWDDKIFKKSEIFSGKTILIWGR